LPTLSTGALTLITGMRMLTGTDRASARTPGSRLSSQIVGTWCLRCENPLGLIDSCARGSVLSISRWLSFSGRFGSGRDRPGAVAGADRQSRWRGPAG